MGALGLVRNFKRVAKSTMGTLRSGPAGVAQAQYRNLTDARVSLDFCPVGQAADGVGGELQHMNVLESADTQARASGGVAKPGQPVLPGSSASQILLDPSVLSNYTVGELVVVDVDYAAGTTDLGTGITGGVASAGAELDADAVRRVSYNVAPVAAITSAGLQLGASLLGGTPASGARVQKVMAFVDREGASFFQEWLALLRWRKPAAARCSFTIRGCRRRLRPRRPRRQWPLG